MISLRNIEVSDQPFIEKLYRSTREKELSVTGWAEDQKERFCVMQLIAQLADYKKKFTDATYQLILYKKQPAGRLYLNESGTEIRLIDISILPQFQGKGIGKEILADLIRTAGEKKKLVTLHVRRDNPARKLYEGLGLKKAGDRNDDIEYMEYLPPK